MAAAGQHVNSMHAGRFCTIRRTVLGNSVTCWDRSNKDRTLLASPDRLHVR